MLKRLLSVDVSVPSLEEGLALYQEKLGLDVLTTPVRVGSVQWQALGVGDESCVRLLEPSGPGPLKESVDSSGHRVQQLSFLVDDLVEAMRQLELAEVAFEKREGSILIPPVAAFGMTVELHGKDFIRDHRETAGGRPKGGLFSKFATADVSVPSIEDALGFYCDKLGMTQLTDVTDGTKGYLRMASVGVGKRSALGLLQPIREGPMQKRVAKAGYGFHQLSFLSDDVSRTVHRLRDRGLRVIIEEADWGDTPDEPGPSTLEAFIHPRSAYGVLVEFFRKDVYVAQDHHPHERPSGAHQSLPTAT